MLMKKTNKILSLALTMAVLFSLTALVSCKGRIPSATDTPADATAPGTSSDGDPFNGGNNTGFEDTTPVVVATPIPATANVKSADFKVDQDTLNQWQARGVAASSGSIYVSAADSSGLFKKGTVIKMNSSDGKSWKEIGSTLLGLRHPVDSTVQGVTASGGTIFAVDTEAQGYIIDSAKGGVKVVKEVKGTDVAAGGGGVYIANGSVEKSDTSLASRTPISSLSATGGIGADNFGSVYAVSGNTIKKADNTGQVTDIITMDLSGPIDVAIDNRNGDIYVLETSMIKRFSAQGQLLVSFPNQATTPISIAVDEMGAVYVADVGSTHKDSKIVKFEAAIADSSVSSMSTGYGGSSYDSSGSYGTNTYGSYGSNTGTTTSSFDSYSNVGTGY